MREMRGEVGRKTPKKEMDNPSYLLRHLDFKKNFDTIWALSNLTKVNNEIYIYLTTYIVNRVSIIYHFVEPWKCPGNGLFPDPDNCQCFYDCANLTPFHECCGVVSISQFGFETG